jgi:hypothetical protein
MYDTRIELETREPALDWRPIAAAVMIAVAVLGTVAVVLGFRSLPDRPEGLVNYRIEDSERWVHADGRPASAPAHVSHETVAHVGRGAVIGAVAWEFPAPDGQSLAYLDPSANSELFVATARSIHNIGALGGDGAPGLVFGSKGDAASVGGVPVIVSWAPDSRYLAYGSATNAPDTLHVSTSDGAWQRTFALEEGFVGEAVWSPDGRYLAVSSYAEGQHGLYVLDTTDWSFEKLLDGCHIIWSPDSKWIAVHRDPGGETGVWLVSPLDAGNRHEITDAERAFPMAWLAE